MKKNFSVKLLFVGFVSCLALSCATLNVNEKVEASDGAASNLQEVTSFAMANGAAVRVRDEKGGEFSDVTGIRFSMYFNTNYEGLIANGETATLGADYEASITISAGEQSWEYTATELKKVSAADANTAADVYAFRAVLASFPDEEFGTKLTATGSLKKDGTEIGTELESQTRSVAQVASKALLNPEEVAKDVKGDLNNYVDGVVTEDNFKFEKTALTTDKYKTGTLNEKIGTTFPEDLAVKWTNTNDKVITVNEETNELSLGEEYGVATLTATLGSKTLTTTVTYGEPTVVKVDGQEDRSNIYLEGNPSATQYLSSSNLTGLGSAYTGNAIAYVNQMDYADLHRVKNPYVLDELNLIKEDYNKVSLWVAYSVVSLNADTKGEIAFGAPNTNKSYFWKQAGESSSFSAGENGATKVYEWHKLQISIDDYISLVAENNYEYCVLFARYNRNSTTSSDSKVYIGDIFFEYVAPSIVTVSSTTMNLFKLNGDSSASKIGTVNATDVDETSEYKGMAHKFKFWNSATAGQGWSVENPYSADELETLKGKVTHVSMWFAWSITSVEEQNGTTYLAGKGYGTASDNFLSYAGKIGRVYANNSMNGKWQKLTITIDEYIALATGSDGTVSKGNRVLLLGLTLENTVVQDSSFIYIGDIFFE